MIKYVALAFFAVVLASVAQGILKKSSMIKRDNLYREYLNSYVVSGYGLMGVSMLLMILAYKGMPYKYGSIVESFTYVNAMIIGYFVFKEDLSFRRILGNVVIIVGIIVFSLG